MWFRRSLPFAVTTVSVLALVGPCGGGGGGGERARAESEVGYVLVVPSDAPTASALDRVFVADAFLKKTTRWPNGELIRPVDRSPDAPVRERFSRSVLKRSVGAVKSYWQQVIFSGRDVPPPEVGTDEDVVRYVATHKGAIGYVAGGTSLDGVRPVGLRE